MDRWINNGLNVKIKEDVDIKEGVWRIRKWNCKKKVIINYKKKKKKKLENRKKG